MTVDAVDIALMVAAALDVVGADYFVGGSVASSFQGEPRATNDIDMVVALPPFDEAEFARRRRVRVRATGEELWLKSPEDSVLRKLLWYREGGEVSDRQWRDVVEVLRVSGAEMSVDYLDSWAPRLGLTGLIARARAEATQSNG